MNTILSRCLCFLFYMLFFSDKFFGQVIKLTNGVSVSSVRTSNKNIEVLNKSIYTYNVSIGLDYLQKEHYFFSSSLGYIQKGGKEYNHFLSGKYKDYKKKWDYVYFSTTFRYKIIPNKNAIFFVGLGPNIDYLLNKSDDFENTIYEETIYKLNKFSLGAKTEMGIVKDFNNIRLGLELSYLVGLTKTGGTPFINLYSDSFNAGISLGYKIK